jgi:hypothetical protein
MSLITALCIVALIIILARTVRVAARMDVHRYTGHRLRFVAFALYWALLAAGAVAITAGIELGGPILLIALALQKISDRRQL